MAQEVEDTLAVHMSERFGTGQEEPLVHLDGI